MRLDLSSFRKAVTALRAVQTKSQDETFMASLDPVTQDAIRSGVIQHFEFTYELAWKFMRRRLAIDIGGSVVDGIPRRDLFRIAAENHLIDDPEAWFEYHRARSQTSQTYDLPVAEMVYRRSIAFADDAGRLLALLEARND